MKPDAPSRPSLPGGPLRPPSSPDQLVRPPHDSRPGLSAVDADVLRTWFESHGQPAYRARQVRDAVWGSLAHSPDDLTTLPAALRAQLAAEFRVDTIESTDVTVADGGLTEKGLHLLSDGQLVESVLMRYPARGARRERNTLCISSQAGCAVGCPFCATGELGFARDLETAEILDQVRHAARRLSTEAARRVSAGAGRVPARGSRLTNIVFMGMGEPLLNLDRVLEAITILSDSEGFGLGARHITVSTSGVVPGIRRLTALGPQFTLAISLHAARDPLRDVLVPLNRRWPVADVVAAARAHAEATGRRVSYEYVMIEGVNDTEADADAVVALLRGDLAHVNLIPMNPVAHTPWRASEPEAIERFAARLDAGRIGVTIRRNRGQEVGAACGQLAAERAGEPAPEAVARRRELIVNQSLAALRGERSDERAPALSGVGE